MTACLILLAALCIVGIILRLFYCETPYDEQIHNKKEPLNDECCGTHEICEKINNRRLSALEYYDDEELDRFKGIEANAYSDSEIEEFRDILLTLLPQDILGWKTSLDKRGIKMPESIYDEFLLLINDNNGNSIV